SLFRRHSRMATAVVHRRFGLWRTALEHAGLADRYSGCPITDKLRRRPSAGMSDGALLDELRAIAAAHGGDTVTAKQVASSPRVSLPVYYGRFGSFAKAVAAAGLRQAKCARRYSDALCFANLEALAMYYGRLPRSGELDKPPSTVSMQAYRLRFGSVRRALALFALRANAAGADPPLAPPDPAVAALLRKEQRRDVRGSLRFQVFQRDRFRCQACGDSPATDLACKLQVDHIEPYSKGGKTTLDNLRTLCAACNWSRGNRTGT
ncbi:MAG: HNH endonuclease, partial [Alphaproteobacteria bacterium]|nr:HNH endonuclease [Alphaproteobacteria bacterium]